MIAVVALLAGSAVVGAVQEGAAIPTWACPIGAPTHDNTENVATAAGPVQFNMARLHSSGAADVGNATKLSGSDVAAVDEAGLRLALKDGPVLVVFYDPKCPHCRSFVIDGGKNAPIEKLSDELAAEKGPAVVKYNIAEHAPPDGYDIVYVPMVFLIKDGKSIPYEGNSLDGLKDFALQKPPKPPAIMDKLVDAMPVFLHKRLPAGN